MFRVRSYNGDGKVDIMDMAIVALASGSYPEPINRT